MNGSFKQGFLSTLGVVSALACIGSFIYIGDLVWLRVQSYQAEKKADKEAERELEWVNGCNAHWSETIILPDRKMYGERIQKMCNCSYKACKVGDEREPPDKCVQEAFGDLGVTTMPKLKWNERFYVKPKQETMKND